MHVYVGSSTADDLFEFLPIACISAVIIIALIYVVVYFAKKQDNKKPLTTRTCKILEKTLKNTGNNIEWYLVEFEDGERQKLRSFRADTILISEGDTGVVTYRGITIESFKREK